MAKSVIGDLLQIFKSSVTAVLPEILVRNALSYSVATQELCVDGRMYCLKHKKVYVVGTGKAAQNMAIELENILGPKIKQGIVSIPLGNFSNVKSQSISFYEGAKNNLPDKKAMNTARKVEDLIMNLTNDDFLIVLISGGGSALLPLPIHSVSLEEKSQLIKKLANLGADIKELNTVRKRISGLKGGQFAIKCKNAQIVTLILSDIVGDPLDLIASGPTTKNNDHPLKAQKIIQKYNLINDIPESIAKVLNEGYRSEEFPMDRVMNVIIGSNKFSTKAALNEAMKLHYTSIELSNIVTGNVKDIAFKYVQLTKTFCAFISGKLNSTEMKRILKEINIPGIHNNLIDILHSMLVSGGNAFCFILGGETTVEVKGTGKGGRNQQLSLEYSKYVNEIKDNFENFDIYFLSAGTDGIDGPTDAAGAISYLNLYSDATKENIDITSYIDNNDSYSFYKKYKDGLLHIITGHTNTNVMDIHIILVKICNTQAPKQET